MTTIDPLSAICGTFGLVLLAFLSMMTVRAVRRLSKSNERLKKIYEERYRLARVCPHCGYDVRAALKPGASGNCPECGQEVFPPPV